MVNIFFFAIFYGLFIIFFKYITANYKIKGMGFICKVYEA